MLGAYSHVFPEITFGFPSRAAVLGQANVQGRLTVNRCVPFQIKGDTAIAV
jgi:hypothetical protein